MDLFLGPEKQDVGQTGSREEKVKSKFREGLSFPEFLKVIRENRELWRRVYGDARIPPNILVMARGLRGPWHLLALGEDWCMDSANTLPYLARLCEAVGGLDLRILRKEEHPQLMQEHLTDGGEAIPVVLILDRNFREVGVWGPRPQPLQDFFKEELDGRPEEARFAGLRGWYRRDGGQSALRELMGRFPASR